MARDSDEYDFFISYARADDRDGWISGFVECLLAVHRDFTGARALTPFFDREDIRSLDDWRSRLYRGLSRSRLFLAFVSPRYFASEWCRREWRTWIDFEIAKHVLSEGAAPLYIVEVPGLLSDLSEQEVARRIAELCEVPVPQVAFVSDASTLVHQFRRRQFSAVQPFYRAGVSALLQDDLRRTLERLARDLDERVAAVQRAALSETTVPPYNRNFSGRVDELLELRDRLKDDRAGVISGVHGLGGVGKTELAFTYAHAFAGAYPGGRFLVPCEGKSSLQEATIVLGDLFRDRIGDEERMQPQAHFAAILRCLRERLDEQGHILLVLDNVTDSGLLAPQETDRLTALGPTLHLLATTRLPAGPGKHVAWMTLGELSPEAALELLDKHRPADDEREAASRIVRQLGGFALAVELVGAYLAAHPSVTYAGLAEGWGLADLDAMASDDDVRLRRHDHERRLEAVLGPTLESLSAPEVLAVEYASCLAPDAVPLPWLKELVVAKHPELATAGRLGDPWEELCRRLLRLSLFSRADGEGHRPRIVRIHRLVQDLVRRRMAERLGETESAVDEYVRSRVLALRDSTDRQRRYGEVEALDALARHRDEHDRSDPWLMSQTGSLWKELATWTRSEAMHRRAFSIRERTRGPEDLETATSCNDLAELLRETNRFVEAESLYRRSLTTFEQSLGPDHPHVATSLNNLALLLQSTNRHAEAESLHRRALAILESACGPDHPDVAMSLNNLALALEETNRPIEAEPLHRRAMEICERSLEPDHRLLATSLNNLARTLLKCGRLREAEPIFRRALSILEGSLATDHPDVAVVLANLGESLRLLGRSDEAEPLLRRACKVQFEGRGPDHPSTAIAIYKLAMLEQALGNEEEARALLTQALSIFRACFHDDGHPRIVETFRRMEEIGLSPPERRSASRGVAPN